MKRFFKGCLILLTIFLFLVGAVIFYLFYEINKPNSTKLVNKPMTERSTLGQVEFKGLKIHEQITNRRSNELVYQAIINEGGLDNTTILKALYKVDSTIELQNRLPLDTDQLIELNKFLHFGSIENERLNATRIQTISPEPSNGRTTIVYKKDDNHDLFIDLVEGSYSINELSIDKVGMVTELVIYDSKNNYLYFERYKYDAFQ